MIARAIVAIGVAACLGGSTTYFRSIAPTVQPSDFSGVWAAARGWLNGLDPYQVVGPSGPFTWPYRLLYPLTAVIIAVPLSVFPIALADGLFVGLGTGLLAWAAWQRPALWWAFASFPMLAIVATSQWAPLLAAAALMPLLGFLLTAKPTIGAALWLAYPSRQAAIGGALLFALTLVLYPTWPLVWLEILRRETGHLTVPARTLPILLISWIWWRHPPARLLGALSLIPQMDVGYEGVLLFLIPETPMQGAVLAIASWGVYAGNVLGHVPPVLTIVWFLYVPCLIMVLYPTVRRRADGRESTEP